MTDEAETKEPPHINGDAKPEMILPPPIPMKERLFGPMTDTTMMMLNTMGMQLDEFFNPGILPDGEGKEVAFTIMCFPIGEAPDGKKTVYLSNAPRPHMIQALKAFIARADEEQAKADAARAEVESQNAQAAGKIN